MFSNPQKSIVKRAQREAGLDDSDYRDALALIAGVRSSTAPELTDRHFDKLLAYMEAIHWRAVDAGMLQRCGSPTAVFRQRGYWIAKNTRLETSRDRFTQSNQAGGIAALEAELEALGCGPSYVSAIKRNVCKGREDAHALHLYRAALERTLKAKAGRAERAADPY